MSTVSRKRTTKSRSAKKQDGGRPTKSTPDYQEFIYHEKVSKTINGKTVQMPTGITLAVVFKGGLIALGLSRTNSGSHGHPEKRDQFCRKVGKSIALERAKYMLRMFEDPAFSQQVLNRGAFQKYSTVMTFCMDYTSTKPMWGWLDVKELEKDEILDLLPRSFRVLEDITCLWYVKRVFDRQTNLKNIS